ncbi:MAG: non-canonical purine NTP pyrophosphatase, partial [Methylococcaceae bacterium]
MPKTLYFITGNDYKLSIAQKAIAATPAIILERRKIECPEIQSHSNDDVAIFSARYAADFLQLPVVVSDAGFTIDALNGFPGPFIKYIND